MRALRRQLRRREDAICRQKHRESPPLNRYRLNQTINSIHTMRRELEDSPLF